MHARLVRPDATKRPVTLTSGPAAHGEIADLLGSPDLTVVLLVPPSPDRPGVRMWLPDAAVAGGLDPNPAARSVAAFLSGSHSGPGLSVPVLFTGGPGAEVRVRPLAKDYDEIITTIAAQIRSHHGDAMRHRQDDAAGPEVR